MANSRLYILGAVAAFLAISPASGMNRIALNPETCEALSKPDETGKLRRPDVAVFDHSRGQLIWPAPAKLRVRDGDVFVVIFRNTAPASFDYSLDLFANEAASANVDLRADSRAIAALSEGTVCLSWRHLELFPLYRVKVTGRARLTSQDAQDLAEEVETTLSNFSGGAAADVRSMAREGNLPGLREKLRVLQDVDERSANAAKEVELTVLKAEKKKMLYPYTFPIWVETAGPKFDYSTGFTFSNLKDEKYFVREPSSANTTNTVERDRNAEDSFRPDLMAFATLRWPRAAGFGISGGVGLSGNDGDPRYFFGPSFTLGKRLQISAGAFGGKVARLPKGQRLGAPPTDDDVTANLENPDRKFKLGFGLSISWLLGKGEQQFISGLGLGGQQSPDPDPDPDSAEPGEDEGDGNNRN